MTSVTISAPDGDLEAYSAPLPLGEPPWPGVVVLHDFMGMRNLVRDHADRLAAAGYVTVAPDLYSRGGILRCVRATINSVYSGQGQAYRDIAAVRAWLSARENCTGKVGVIGFCMGGGFALMTANQGWGAAAPAYGPLPKDLPAALKGACPIVGHFGQRDPGIKKGTAAKLSAALDAEGIPNDVKEYPGAGHCFMENMNQGIAAPLLRVIGFGYHHASAADAWNRTFQFFAEHLQGA